jgi:exopolysaccharide biosynthesis polyprenyl glycosylphosphotransferase
MQTTIHRTDSYVDTPLTNKVQRASRSLPRKVQWRLYILGLILNDLIILAAAFRLAYVVRFETGFALFQQDVAPSVGFYQAIVTLLIPAWIIIYALSGLYNRKNLLGGTSEYSLLFNGTTIGAFIVIAAGFLLPEFVLARGWLVISWLLVFVLLALSRFLLRRVIYMLREEGYFLSPAVIIGANDEGLSLARQLTSWKTSGFHILGFIDKKLNEGDKVVDHLHCLGSLDDLGTIVNKYNVEEIILASSAFSSRDGLLEIFKNYGVASGVSVRMSSGLYEIITTGLTVKEFAYVPLVEVNQVRLSGIDSVMKLALDYLLTIPLLILLSPVLLALAIAVKLSSPGSIIHRRRVMGVNGKQFDAFKFRTMYEDGDAILQAHPELQDELTRNHKLKDDPRVTGIGHMLRKTSLDELPQLVNVLRGEMSLVGPRMISPEEILQYDQWDINLLTVRPGITGLWQISGRSDVSYEQRVRFDMHYIRNWTIWLDLQLLSQTIPAVLKKRGAY